MFEKLLESFRNATNPFQGFLGELWTVWSRDAGRAILLARWSWQQLPEELIGQAGMLQQQAQAAQAAHQINTQVNTQLGMLGIFPGSTASPSFGFGMNPDHAMFVMIMGTIRAHRGDPPGSPEMAQLAETVLRGQMDPVDAMIAAAPQVARPQLMAAAQMLKMTGMYQFLRLSAIIAVASALPRGRIPVLLPEVGRGKEPEIKKRELKESAAPARNQSGAGNRPASKRDALIRRIRKTVANTEKGLAEPDHMEGGRMIVNLVKDEDFQKVIMSQLRDDLSYFADDLDVTPERIKQMNLKELLQLAGSHPLT